MPAILCVGMYDIVLQNFNPFDRVVLDDHHKVCRVKVDRNTSGTQAVQELTQTCSRFRACLDCEVCLHRIGKLRQFPAGFLHDLIARMGGIFRYNADMGRHNIRFKVTRQFQNPFGAFNQLRVFLPVAESHPQVTAQGRHFQAIAFDSVQQFPSGSGIQVFRCHFTFGRVNLDTLCPYLMRLDKRLIERQPEGIQHDAN